ncbi:hypothetical protein GP486_008386 [Trichoglossum hirsutum]|uniref:Uncharacterized protein n=1 Tax=Trichoglossum hirsutum TaxID=265104 RepID=A0A9P8IA40_9PEZI|nr:hypothetical protein GP486_008386 [Trichoglossum hirsutum]
MGYLRMKNLMSDHVGSVKDVMFRKSTDRVRGRLDGMVSSVEITITDRTKEIFARIKRDYLTLLGGGDPLNQGEPIPKRERTLGEGAVEIIKGHDCIWRELTSSEGGGHEGRSVAADEEIANADEDDVNMEDDDATITDDDSARRR